MTILIKAKLPFLWVTSWRPSIWNNDRSPLILRTSPASLCAQLTHIAMGTWYQEAVTQVSNKDQMVTTQMQQLSHPGLCNKRNYYKWDDTSRDPRFPGGPEQQHPLRRDAAQPRITQRHPDWLLFMNTTLTRRVIVPIWLMKWQC